MGDTKVGMCVRDGLLPGAGQRAGEPGSGPAHLTMPAHHPRCQQPELVGGAWAPVGSDRWCKAIISSHSGLPNSCPSNTHPAVEGGHDRTQDAPAGGHVPAEQQRAKGGGADRPLGGIVKRVQHWVVAPRSHGHVVVARAGGQQCCAGETPPPGALAAGGAAGGGQGRWARRWLQGLPMTRWSGREQGLRC